MADIIGKIAFGSREPTPPGIDLGSIQKLSENSKPAEVVYLYEKRGSDTARDFIEDNDAGKVLDYMIVWRRKMPQRREYAGGEYAKTEIVWDWGNKASAVTSIIGIIDYLKYKVTKYLDCGGD